MLLLTQWGERVYGWLHGCLCHEEDLINGKRVSCVLKGRRAAEWAGHKYAFFLNALRTMDIPD
eukprot:3710651-Karenia_brevis.AAC.1